MNYLGLALSFLFVFLMIGLSTIFQKKGILSEEGARKFIHIGVSNWWIIAMIFFDQWYIAIIAPIVFIALNYASYRMNLFKAMERGGKGNLGTVYFPISLLVLIIFSFLIGKLYIGAFGILILGYGDGLAAVIGSKYGKHKLPFNKSLEGSMTMFLASLIVAMVIFIIYLPIQFLWIAPIIALLATVIELFTPKGLDNLTVPILTSLISYGILAIFQLV